MAPSHPASESPSPSSPAPVPGLSSYDIGLLALVGLVWGSAYVFIREGIVLGASPLLFAAVRYLLSAAAFAALAVARREPTPRAREALVSAGLGGILIIGMYGGLLYWGEQYTTGGYAAVLAATAPILTVVVAYSLLPSERLGALALGGLGLAFAGAVVLVAPALFGSSVGTWPGPLFVLAAFLSTAFGTVLLRRIAAGRQGLWQIGLQFAVGGLLLAGVGALLPYPEVLPSVPGVWYSLAALVLLSSVIGYFAYFALHHRVGPVRANIVAYLVPLVGVGIGSGFFGEPITAWEVAGFLIVIGGLTLLIRESVRRTGAGGVPAPGPSPPK